MSAAGHTDPHGQGHGNSVAAWTAVSIITLGFIVGGVAFAFSSVWMFWTGVVIGVLGVVAGKVLAMMGFGVSEVGAPMRSASVGDDDG